VVEHDEDIMKAADYIIDIGPEAGTHGGYLVGQGSYKEILKRILPNVFLPQWEKKKSKSLKLGVRQKLL